ncbi:MAG: TIGR03364 family FAD-dependent oxidoreductase [Chloroflexota bacterium]|nr:TIGR03364 family FAD-dependent oxidoreductase [Chloroflexota bacterium]
MIRQTQVAVVGAGIVGLAHALAAARKGYSVTLFERNARAVGASVRNFGMIWAIGKPPGKIRDRVLRSREIWIEIAHQAGLWLDQNGSLHVAHHQDEIDVLTEFYETLGKAIGGYALLSPEQTLERSGVVKAQGLRGALWSETEMLVNPMEAIARLPQFLAERYGVTLRFDQTVRAIDYPTLVTTDETWRCEHIFVCTGVDFETLFPEAYRDSGIVRAKLQMLRTIPQPANTRIGPSLANGPLMTGYLSFAHCTSLKALKARINHEMPEVEQHGMTVYMSQLPTGEVTIGDTHVYDNTVDPFDREDLNQMMLNHVERYVQLPTLAIAQRWHGVYAKRFNASELIVKPVDGVTVVNGLGGGGMSQSFGLAEEVIAKMLF